MTLGVELVAKPTLLFLDEPTSGLDGQSAYNIVRFLRRLVDGGQAVLVRAPLASQPQPFTTQPLTCVHASARFISPLRSSLMLSMPFFF